MPNRKGAGFTAIVRSPNAGAIRRAGRRLAGKWPWPVRTELRGLDFYVDLRSAIGRGILVSGQFDEAVFAALAPSLRSGATVIDVGANIGYYSVLAALEVGDAGAVHAFEIDPRPLRCLRRSIASNALRNLHLHEVAVGSHDGFGGLHMEADCGHSHVGATGDGKRVPVVRLDSWLLANPSLRRVDAIKIDVEGGEAGVLRGALGLIREFRPAIVCEAYDRDGDADRPGAAAIQAILAQEGYVTSWVDGAFSPTIRAIPESPTRARE